MALLIDGYNLLHVTGIVARGTASFQRSRQALLNVLAASIDPNELPHSVIVFDAADAPPGLPKTLDHDGLTVHYARDYPDADTMIEELIRQHDAPRSLTVVSSDHRIQRAAKRRKSTTVDSDRWYTELLSKRRRRGASQQSVEVKPTHDLDAREVAYWLAEFGDDSDNSVDSNLKADENPAIENPEPGNEIYPFPPGYGDDLLDDDDS